MRIVYCVLLISGITLENAYSGGLKALLTIPRYEEKISTVRQFVDRGYHWGAPQPAWAYSIMHAQVHDDRAMYVRFDAIPNEKLRNLSFTRNYAIGLERLHAGSFTFYDYVQLDSLAHQSMLKEDVYFEFTRGYSIRGWPLMDHFDEAAGQILQHGLLHAWETSIINYYLDFSIANYLRLLASGYQEEAGPEVLQVAHIYGPLAMLAVGVVAAALAFGAEHAMHRMKQPKPIV